MSSAREKIASDLNLVDENVFAFCWIVDYPMYEKDKITVGTETNGQLITLSYQVEQQDEIRCYLIYNGGQGISIEMIKIQCISV